MWRRPVTPRLSKMTMTMPGDDRVLEQITKQLNKLIDTIKVTDLTQKRYVNRELVLVEIAAPDHRKRAELADMANLFDAKVVSVQPQSLTIQLVDDKDRVQDFLALLQPFKILDLSRSGVVVVAQGNHE